MNSPQNEIEKLLASIEEKYSVKIIHAIESGSRAWGFPSKDSDYDIRFIYRKPLDWYLSPFEKKNTIEIEMQGDLDAGGWDVKKSLLLLHKGNAVLHEWLNSPIVYLSDPKLFKELKAFAERKFDPVPAFYHYMSLAKNKFLDEKTRSNAKYFLYGLRAVLCAKYIFDTQKSPPVVFDNLVERYLSPGLKVLLEKLLDQKLKNKELDSFLVDEELWLFAIGVYSSLRDVQLSARLDTDRASYDQMLKFLLTE